MKILNSNEIILDDIRKISKNCKSEINFLSGKNVLFTGAAGFIGYLFVQFLNSIGADNNCEKVNIYMLDNFIRGKKKWIQDMEKYPNVNLINCDITKDFSFSTNFDYVIHAASIASPTYYRKFPIETIDANVFGLRKLLDLCLKQIQRGKAVKGFLFFSSSEIYGDPIPTEIPTRESYWGNVSCMGPRACYDESKRLGETLCINFFKQHNLPVKIVRPFNNYGPGLDINDKRVLPDFFKSILNNTNIILYSDGSATRTFCYISDAIEGYVKTLVNGKNGEAYNIGTQSPEISILDLAKKITEISDVHLNFKLNIEFKKNKDTEYLEDNPIRRCPNIDKAIDHLKYNPSINLQNGLEKTFFWYKENF